MVSILKATDPLALVARSSPAALPSAPSDTVEANPTDRSELSSSDQAVYKQAEQANQGKPVPPGLQKDISGIRDDQTRIRSVADYYGVQDRQLRARLGVGTHVMTWDGWANLAANLVSHVHQGEGLAGFLGKLTGANDDLARGNKKVFDDIAPVTDGFLQNVDSWKTPDGSFDPQAFKQWVGTQCQELQSDPRFQQGFEDYAKADCASSEKDKDAYLIAGNIRLAQHEQRLLQPNIADAMHGGSVGQLVKAGSWLLGPVEDWASGRVGTKIIPGVKLPSGQQLRIDCDITPPDGQAIPPAILGASSEALQTLHDAIRDSGLEPGQTHGTGASDYSDYDQRIKVLTALILANSVQS